MPRRWAPPCPRWASPRSRWRSLSSRSTVLPSASATQRPADEPGLYLVTLSGPGVTGTPGPETGSAARARLRAAQDATLASVGAGEPVYRWTEALNGYAVELTSVQAEALAADPAVALVEPNEVRPLAASPAGGDAARSRLLVGSLPRRRRSGRRRRRHRPVAGEPALRGHTRPR